MTTTPQIPHSREAEEAAIGCVLINPEAFYDLAFLKASDFYIHRNMWIWGAVSRLFANRMDVDLLTVADELDREGKLAEIGGPAYLTALVSNVPSSLNAQSYGRIVKDHATRRRYINIANEIAQFAYDENKEVNSLPAFVRDNIDDAEIQEGDFVHISAPLSEIYDEIQEAEAEPCLVWGLPTGFKKFDEETGGIESGWLVWLAGEPGIGKTWSLTQFALSMATRSPGALISMEMKDKSIARRALSGLSGIRIKSMKSGLGLPPNWRGVFGEAAGELERLPIYISDKTITTNQLRASLKMLKRDYGIGWFAVDYALLFADTAENEIVRTEIISRNLKHICNDLDLAGLVLQSVIKTGMDSTGNGRAKSMMRGSGQMIHDADMILFLTKFEELDETDGSIRQSDRERMVTLWTNKGRELESLPVEHLIRRENSPFFDEFNHEKYINARNKVTT